MWFTIALIGFIIFLASLLSIIVTGILFIINKKKSAEKNKFTNPLLISGGVFVCSIALVIFSISSDISRYTNEDNEIPTNNDAEITNVKISKNTSVSADSLKKINVGDSYELVEKELGYPKEVDIDYFMWHYDGDDKLAKDSYAVISFDFENNVESIEQEGIISKDTTRVDADGINNYDNPKKSTGIYKEDTNDSIDSTEDDKDLVQYDTEDLINSFVDKNFKFDTQLDELELNENLGTKKDGDYIALVHMTIGKTLSAKSGLDWIDKYTNYLASELAAKQSDISEITFFWTMPEFADKDYNIAKYTLKRNGKKLYFESEWQDNSLLEK